jgi:hypothetical protein
MSKETKAFQKHSKSALKGYNAMYEQMERQNNLLHYKLHGDGAFNDITGEPSLTYEQRLDAHDYEQKVIKIQKAQEGVYKMLKELEKEAEHLDTFMNFI